MDRAGIKGDDFRLSSHPPATPDATRTFNMGDTRNVRETAELPMPSSFIHVSRTNIVSVVVGRGLDLLNECGNQPCGWRP